MTVPSSAVAQDAVYSLLANHEKPAGSDYPLFTVYQGVGSVQRKMGSSEVSSYMGMGGLLVLWHGQNCSSSSCVKDMRNVIIGKLGLTPAPRTVPIPRRRKEDVITIDDGDVDDGTSHFSSEPSYPQEATVQPLPAAPAPGILELMAS